MLCFDTTTRSPAVRCTCALDSGALLRSDVRRLCSLATLDALANPTLGLDERHAINANGENVERDGS